MGLTQKDKQRKLSPLRFRVPPRRRKSFIVAGFVRRKSVWAFQCTDIFNYLDDGGRKVLEIIPEGCRWKGPKLLHSNCVTTPEAESITPPVLLYIDLAGNWNFRLSGYFRRLTPLLCSPRSQAFFPPFSSLFKLATLKRVDITRSFLFLAKWILLLPVLSETRGYTSVVPSTQR